MSSGTYLYEKRLSRWHRKAKKYNRNSILELALEQLHRSNDRTIESMKYRPWVTCVAIKRICQDVNVVNTKARLITPAEFQTLMQEFYDLEKSIAGKMKGMPIGLMMRRILRPQGGFQTTITKAYVREALLVLKSSSPYLKNEFLRLTGCDLQTFIELSFVCVTVATTRPSLSIKETEFKLLEGAYEPAQIRRFLRAVSKTPDQLTSFFRQQQHAGKGDTSEHYEFPLLAQAPILRSEGVLRIWNRQLLYRGLEHFVHNTLSQLGGDYAQRFGKIFEAHVASVTDGLKVTVYAEKDLKEWRTSVSQKHPDGLIDHPKCNVILEAKSGLYREKFMTIGDGITLKKKAKEIIKGIDQALQASSYWRDSDCAPSTVKAKKDEFLLIVTNIQLLIGNGLRLIEMADGEVHNIEDQEASQRLPLQNVFILNIDEYEWLMMAARSGDLDIYGFLKRCSLQEMDVKNSVFSFSQRLDRENIPYRCAPAISGYFTELTNRVQLPL